MTLSNFQIITTLVYLYFEDLRFIRFPLGTFIKTLLCLFCNISQCTDILASPKQRIQSQIMRTESKSSSNIRSSLLAKSQSFVNSPSMTNYSALPPSLVQTLGDNSCPHIRKKNLYDLVADFSGRFKVIRPENKWLLAWHAFIMFILLYYIFEIGLLWGYGKAVWVDELAVLYSVNCIFITALVADCVLSNFKAYYSHGLLVTHNRLIVKRYLRVRVYIDILAIISIMIPFISGEFALNWVKALFLLKIYSVYEIDKEFIRVSQLKVSYHTFYLLSRLVLLLVLGSHYLGIWFYMIDYWVYQNNYYGPNTPNICWIYNAESYSQLVLLQPWYGQYLYTMYFSIGTMTTIAYGDITPLNPLETLYITIALIAYTLGFAYILSQILRILMEAQASKFEHTNNLLIVSNMMKNNLIKQRTQSKVKSYFEKVWKEEIYRNREVQNQLIQKLPHRIRNELFSELYYSFFLSAGLYFHGGQQIVRTNFIVAIANEIREQRLVEDHVLFKQGQEYDPDNLNNHLFYFIKELKKGKLKPSIELGVNDLVIQTVAQGNVGIVGFYTGQTRDHWAKVILSVLVYELPRKVLLENLHLATEIEHENVFLLQQIVGNQQCMICKHLGHNFKTCQYVTYQPNKKELIAHHSRTQQIVESANIARPQNNNGGGSQWRKNRLSFNTMVIWNEIKNIKYKIKRKYEMMMHSKYYRDLFSRKNRNKGKIKDDFTVENKRLLRKTTMKLSPRMTAKQSPRQAMQEMSMGEQFVMEMNEEQQTQVKNENQKYHRAATLIPLTGFEIIQKQQSSDESSQSSSSEQSVDLENYLKQTELYIRNLEQFEARQNEAIEDPQETEYDLAKQYQIYYVSANISNVINKFNNKGSNNERRNVENIMVSNEIKDKRGKSKSGRLSDSFLSYERSDRDNLLNESVDESLYTNRNFLDPANQRFRMHSMRYSITTQTEL